MNVKPENMPRCLNGGRIGKGRRRLKHQTIGKKNSQLLKYWLPVIQTIKINVCLSLVHNLWYAQNVHAFNALLTCRPRDLSSKLSPLKNTSHKCCSCLALKNPLIAVNLAISTVIAYV